MVLFDPSPFRKRIILFFELLYFENLCFINLVAIHLEK